MGYVYAGHGVNSNQFKIGNTNGELAKRLAQHRSSHPAFAIYRYFQTTQPGDAEMFLKKRFADKRVPNSKEWFAVGKEEVDEAFSALEAFLLTHLTAAQQRAVKGLANQKSNGLFLEPRENHLAKFERCRKLRIEIDMRELEFEHLTDQLKFEIGCYDGIEGLFTWRSQVQIKLDQKLVKEKHLEVWEACRRDTIVRQFHLLDRAEES